MAIVSVEWLNSNEGRNYPLHDDATRLDVDGKLLPNDVLADASIWVPESAGSVVYLSSVGITPALVTLTFLAADEDAFCPSSGSGSAIFTPLAVLSLTKPVIRFKNYALEALLPGVGGWVSLGAAAAELDRLSLRFEGPEATQLLARAVRSYPAFPVGSVGKEGNSTKLTGLVKLLGTPGAIRTFKTTRTIDGILRDVVGIGLDLGETAVTTLQDFAGVCGGRPQAATCRKAPIETLHGVAPNQDGNIDIVFTGDEVIGDVRKGIVIDYPIGISDVEPHIGSSAEGPPIVSSESGPIESSESGPVEPVGSSVSGPGYCEDFEDGVANELVVRAGGFTIQDVAGLKRYISMPGQLIGQIALDPSRTLLASDVYLVKSTMRPITLGTGSGYLVFGYKDINDFMFAGFTLRGQNPSYPNGRFFFGHKVSTAVNWPNGLGDGHIFDISYAPPAPMVRNDYRVIVQIEGLAPGVNIARLEATWDDGSPRSLHQVFVLPTIFNESGIAGLGAVASETEFDDFGINCLSSSSDF